MVLPGQQRRRLAGDFGYVVQLFPPHGHVYSYTTRERDNESLVKRSWWAALYGFTALNLLVGSYSWVDLLVVLGLGVTESEVYSQYKPEWALYDPYMEGISGVNGWLGGYLLARLVSRQRTWASAGGLAVLYSYVKSWKDDADVHHECHFVTLAEGFLAGLALERFGPKPKPIGLVRRHVGKFALGSVLGFLALGPLLRSRLPDPPGVTNPTTIAEP